MREKRIWGCQTSVRSSPLCPDPRRRGCPPRPPEQARGRPATLGLLPWLSASVLSPHPSGPESPVFGNLGYAGFCLVFLVYMKCFAPKGNYTV